MPELPEVETTRRGIEPYITGRVIQAAVVRQRALRWPVPRHLSSLLAGQRVIEVVRRGKYLLLRLEGGTVLIHLGMSGHLRVLKKELPAQKHDHVDIVFEHGDVLRFTDPRRFGAVLWLKGDPFHHPLLLHLGPEPLGDQFCGKYLFERSRGRKVAVKSFIMDGKVVVGVGNIYANEALFLAGIRPARGAGRLSSDQCEQLALEIKWVLGQAIKAGGTTLRDFRSAEGQTGYFQQELMVYGQGGKPCPQCGTRLKETRLDQRSTVYCPRCQP